MTDRTYDFALPLTVANYQLGFLIGMLVQNDLWYKLPTAVAIKINAASSGHSDLIVTKRDLDSLSDPVYDAISKLVPR